MSKNPTDEKDDADLQEGGRERDFAAADPIRRREHGSDRPKSVDSDEDEKKVSAETG